MIIIIDIFGIILFALTALQRLDPFDFDGVAVFAQGDCDWEDFVAFGCGSKMLPLQG